MSQMPHLLLHEGPSLPDSLYEYYARESVSPCSLDDIIVVEGPSHPHSLDEYYTRSSGSPCSIDDAGSFSYKAFLGGMLSKSRSMSSNGARLSMKSEPFAKKFLFPSLSSSQTPRSSSTLDGSEKSEEIRQVIDPPWTVANKGSKLGALVSSYPASYEEYILSESVSSASDMEVGSTSSGSIASLTRFVEERPTLKSILFRRELSSNSSFQDLSTSDNETACRMYTLSVENSNTTDSTLDTKSVENSYATSFESQQETTTSSSASNEDTENSWTKRKRQLLPPLHPRTNVAGIRAGKLGVLLQ